MSQDAITQDPPPTEARRADGSAVRRSGLAAGAVALALFWLASAVLDGVAYPPSAVAEAIIRATPGDVATALIEALGHWARNLLSAGAFVAGLVVAAAVLVATSKTSPRSWLAAAVLGLVSFVAAVIDPVSTPRFDRLIPVVLVAVIAYKVVADGVYASLVREREFDPSRRGVVRIGFGGALVLATGGGVLGWLARAFGGPNRDVRLATPDVKATIPPRDEFPKIPGLSPEITSVGDHYVVDIDLVKPSVEAAKWRLGVDGLVERPLELDFGALQRGFEVVEEYSVLSCVSNEVGGGLIGNSAWGGVRLKDVLAEAGLKDDAVDVVFTAADGYSDSIPIEVAMDPTVLLAVSQNSEPLTQGHGFPCRVRVPAIYGMKNVKWLESIKVVGSDYEGYWQQRGWSDSAVVRTESRIDVAGEGFEARQGDQTWIAGIAWAGLRGISRVEVSTNGGTTWDEARLKDPLAPHAWRLWAYRWTPEKAGDIDVAVRATDGAGKVQTASVSDPHPAGATGYHHVSVRVL